MSYDTYRDRLEKMRAQYRDRRSVAAQLLDDAVRLVDTTVAMAQVELDVQLAARDARLAEAERQHQIQLARAEDRATRAEDRVRALEAMRTNVRESRETIDDGVLVRISAPKVVGRNDEESPWSRPWTLGELETVAYRLRLGGAVDDTEVRIKHDHTEATVPYPELVLDAPPAKPRPLPEVPAVPFWRRQVLLPAVVAVAMVLVFLAGVTSR